MMINEDGTMVGSLEEMCVTSGLASASLVNIFLFPVIQSWLYRPETALFGHFMASPDTCLISAHSHLRERL